MERDEKGRFPAGVSGNPAGRPKSSLAAALAAEGERKKKGKTNARALAELAWKKALDGNLAWAEWLGDRIMGKAPQSLEVTGDKGAEVLPSLAALSAAQLAALAEATK